MYIEAFTNRTFFSTRVSTFLPEDPAYHPGDELELCYVADRPDLAGLSPEDIAQSVYGTLNPKNVAEQHSDVWPSLSMADVISCRDGEAEWSLSVEVLGFATVSTPIFASEAEHASYRRKLGAETS